VLACRMAWALWLDFLLYVESPWMLLVRACSLCVLQTPLLPFVPRLLHNVRSHRPPLPPPPSPSLRPPPSLSILGGLWQLLHSAAYSHNNAGGYTCRGLCRQQW
jgi:hypothetical protein